MKYAPVFREGDKGGDKRLPLLTVLSSRNARRALSRTRRFTLRRPSGSRIGFAVRDDSHGDVGPGMRG